MATNKRNYPNDYFAWYSDDTRVAIVAKVLTNEVNENSSSDMYDTYTGDDVGDGLRIHTHSKYTSVDDIDNNLTTGAGLDSGLHPAVVDYVKSRILEDMGDIQNSQYFRQKYEVTVRKYPHRKSGVRFLSVPSL